MLSKVIQSTIEINDSSFTTSASGTNLKTLFSVTTTKEWKITLNTSHYWSKTSASGSVSYSAWIYINGVAKQALSSYTSLTPITYTTTDIYPAGTEISIVVQPGNTYTMVVCKGKYVATTPEITTDNYNYKIYPNEIGGLWDTIQGTIYGVLNNSYVGGIMIDKDTTATTGSITLGNAIGYIKVNLNWEIVKIPYYWN